MTRWALAMSLGLGLAACGDGGHDGGSAGIGPGVGQGGAQDFGQFRAILEDGELPGSETIDDVGFFAEHKLALPAPDCGQTVCLHGLYGVMGNMISGSSCTIMLIGMNTPVDPATIERPPFNLALAIDTSASMRGENLEHTRSGLLSMLGSLRAEDKVTLVTFDTHASIVSEHVSGTAPELRTAIEELAVGGKTNTYGGLRTAFEAVSRHADTSHQNRVVLLSDGVTTTGITNDAKTLNLARAYAELGFGLTTIGVGTEFDVVLMRTLAEVGGGSFYFVEDPEAVDEVFVEEVETFLVPLAEDASISIDVSSGYELREIYGTKLSEVEANSGSISIPTLQLAHRLSADDDGQGRRGGGGAILVELTPSGEPPEGSGIGSIDFSYRTPSTEDYVGQIASIESALMPGETPEDGYFSGEAVEKGFVMLNIYVGFRMAAERAAAGDGYGALAVLSPLGANVEGWLTENDDADIADDLRFIELFIDNLEDRGFDDPPPDGAIPDPWPRD